MYEDIKNDSALLLIPEKYGNKYVYCIFGEESWETEDKIGINVEDVEFKRISTTTDKTGRTRGRAYMPHKYANRTVWLMPEDDGLFQNSLNMEFETDDLLERKVKQARGGGHIMLPASYLGKDIRVIFEKKW